MKEGIIMCVIDPKIKHRKDLRDMLTAAVNKIGEAFIYHFLQEFKEVEEINNIKIIKNEVKITAFLSMHPSLRFKRVKFINRRNTFIGEVSCYKSTKEEITFKKDSNTFKKDCFDRQNQYIDFKHAYLKSVMNTKNTEIENMTDNEPKITKCIKINNIPKIDAKCLMSLISCFGNIERIVVMKPKRLCLVQFQSEEDSEYAIRHLNLKEFFGEKLKVSTSVYTKLEGGGVNDGIEFYQGREKYHRYKEKLKTKKNKPSEVLFFNDTGPKCDPITLLKLIDKIHAPLQIKKKKDSEPDKAEFHVLFRTVAQSMEVLSKLHNEKVNGKYMKVSFSNDKKVRWDDL